MRLRHKELRLKVPSLLQFNDRGYKKGQVWCGRASAAMIYNYYKAARAGGMENAIDQLVINQRDRKPHDFVLSDGTIAVDGFNLIGAMQKAKSEGWVVDASQWDEKNNRLIEDGVMIPPALYPKAGRGAKPTEAEIRKIFSGVLRALEMYNPALFYSGLSSNQSEPRHIVVISGYRIGPDGGLWLLIDDPGSHYTLAAGVDHVWGTAGHVKRGMHEEVIVQLVPETHDTQPGRRYWLRAARLFDSNDRSYRKDDLWCDHQDRPGLCVWYNDRVPEPLSACVETSAMNPGLPIDLRDPDAGGPAATLPLAWANARVSGAPYPIGTNRAWHNGIHFWHDEAAFASKDVLAIAPGEIVFVRFPEAEGTSDDAGTVLVRHGFDPATLRIHDPRRDATPPEGTIWIYSLYMHLLGGDDGAQNFLARLEHSDFPGYKVFLPAPGTCAMFAYDPGGDLVEIDAKFEPGRSIDRDATFEVEAPDGTRIAPIADRKHANLEAWEDGRPLPPLVPDGATEGVYDTITGKPIELRPVADNEEMRLAAHCDEDGEWGFLAVSAEKKPQWLAVEGDPQAGFQLAGARYCVHDTAGKATMKDAPEDCELLFVRGPHVPLTVETSGKNAEGRLLVPSVLTGGEPLWCCNDRNQPALKRNAEDGAAVWPDLAPCVRVDNTTKKKIATDEDPRSPAGAKLSYRNPVNGKILETNVSLSGVSLLRRGKVRYTKDGDHALIDDHEAKLSAQWAKTCAHTRQDIDKKVGVKDPFWPLITFWQDKIGLYSQTVETGDKRWFPDDSMVEIEAKGRHFQLLDGPRKTSGKMRAWPKLIPIAGLDSDQYDEKHAELLAAFQGPAADSLGRITKGESRLYGVQLGKKYGWIVEDGVVRVRDDFAGEALALFVEVAGRGTRRSFPEKKGDGDNPVIAVKPSPELRLRPVCEFRSNGLNRALVEVCPAAHADMFMDNSADLEAWEAREAFIERVRVAVTSGDIIELAPFEADDELFCDDKPFEHWRYVGREPIGTLGKTGPGGIGVHVETFAGENILPSDGPNGQWRELQVKSGEKPPSKEFYAEVVGEILSDPRLSDLSTVHEDGTGCVGSARSSQPVPATQWLQFCSDECVDRALSKFIAVHETEWKVDWETVASNAGHIRGLYNMFGLTAGWWPTDIEFEGLEADEWFFYHPLRLLEWLTTGVDARIELNSSKTTAMQLEFGEEQFEMAPGGDDLEGESFRIRSVLADRAECHDTVLILDGVDTLEPRIPVKLVRGELVEMWLCEPTAEMEARPRPTQIATAVRYQISDELSHENTGVTYLLADPTPHLAPAGFSRATFEVEARYNVSMPESLVIELGDPSLTLESVELRGADDEGLPKTWEGVKHTIALKPNAPAPDAITMYRKVIARIDVVAGDKVGVDTTVEATVDGGELIAPVALDRRVGTRVIGKDARGQDVAKLQMYLHQFRVDGKPCYAGEIDGHAGEGTAKAIWRFALHFCASPDWDREFASITAAIAARDLAPFEAPAAGTIDKAAKSAYLENGHPEVGAEMIAELVRHYGMPSVLPAVALTVDAPKVDAALTKVIEKMGASGRSTLFPDPDLGLASNEVLVKVAIADPPVPGDPSTVAVTLKLGEGTPFSIVGGTQRTLGELLSAGIRLKPNGVVSVDKAACKLSVVASGGTSLASVRLGGTRNLLDGGGSSRSYDALQVQQWLNAYPKPSSSDKHFYESTLDGQWQKGSKASLKAFHTEVAPEETYSEVLARLIAGPSAAQEHEAAQ